VFDQESIWPRTSTFWIYFLLHLDWGFRCVL